MRTKNFPAKLNERRKNVVIRLGKQLSRGVKMTKSGEEIPLTKKNVDRIKKEMFTLNSRLSSTARDKRSKRKRV